MEDYRIIERLDQIIDALENPPVKDLDIIEIDETFSICRSIITSIGLSTQGPVNYYINVGYGDGDKRGVHVLIFKDKEYCTKKCGELLRLWKGEVNEPS